MSALLRPLAPVLQPVLGSVLDASAGGAPRFRGLDLDFAQGRYAVNGPYQPTLPIAWSFSRTGAGTAERANGYLVPFPTSVPRITDRGLLSEDQRTNKVTVRNSNPVDTSGVGKSGDPASVLSVVSDISQLADSGLSEVCSGNVYLLDNSLGSTEAFAIPAGAAGNTSGHVASAYVRGSGSAMIRIGSAGGAGSTTVNLSPIYNRGASTSVQSATNSQCAIGASAGSIVYFILPQLEQGASVTSPIVTVSSSATRGADIASIIVPQGVSKFTAYYGSGQTATGAVTPGQTFDISASNRPWFNGYLQRLVMQ